jgi:hypothetical protein
MGIDIAAVSEVFREVLGFDKALVGVSVGVPAFSLLG